MHEQRDITTVEQLNTEAAHIWQQVQEAGDHTGAKVLALSGDLGAGKTTFMQALALAAGVSEMVTSPTFVIMKQYTLPQSDQFLVHIDAYRIESPDEMRVLGLPELLKDPRAVVCIEWAERIAELLPSDVLTLTFAVTASGERTLTIS